MGRLSIIENLINEELAGSDHFLVDAISNESETEMKFFIDGLNGVDIQVCSRLSRKISRTLEEIDTDDTPYRFEVSSPGADRPLIDKRQYHQHVGRDLDVKLLTGEDLTGELLEVNDGDILLNIPVSKHKKSEQKIDVDQIEHSTVKISFKRNKK